MAGSLRPARERREGLWAAASPCQVGGPVGALHGLCIALGTCSQGPPALRGKAHCSALAPSPSGKFYLLLCFGNFHISSLKLNPMV